MTVTYFFAMTVHYFNESGRDEYQPVTGHITDVSTDGSVTAEDLWNHALRVVTESTGRTKFHPVMFHCTPMTLPTTTGRNDGSLRGTSSPYER